MGDIHTTVLVYNQSCKPKETKNNKFGYALKAKNENLNYPWNFVALHCFKVIFLAILFYIN